MTRSALPAVNRRQALQFGGVVAALSLFGLTACSTREVVADGAADAGASKEITVTDQFGNTLVFAKAVERIATTIIPSPSMIAAADQGLTSIVSVNSSAQLQAKNGIFGTMFPELLDLPVASGIDFVPNVEAILQQNPDVVIQWGDQGDGIIDPLRAAGLPVLLLKYGTQEDLEEWITIFGTLLGQEKRATEILATMHADRATVEKAVKKAVAAAGTAPRVVELYSLAETKVSAADSYMDFWITLAGGTNVAAAAGSGTSLAVTKEQILLWNPEVLFLGNFSPATPADIYADADFASLDAVRNKRVYKVPLGGFPWDPPCNESNLMWLWATELVHPGTTGAGLRARIATTFEYLYAYSPSEEQIDGILHVDLNASSSGYSVFSA